jgi:hypothetical protein
MKVSELFKALMLVIQIQIKVLKNLITQKLHKGDRLASPTTVSC